MSKTVTFQQRIQQLRELEADLPEILGRAAEEATKRAVQAAAAATPPKEGSGRGSAYSGTHTLTGELKAHWGHRQPHPAGYRWQRVSHQAGQQHGVCQLCQRWTPNGPAFCAGTLCQS